MEWLAGYQSPMRDMRRWMQNHTNTRTAERLPQLLASDVLPHEVRVILDRWMFAVPRSGLFTTKSNWPSRAQASLSGRAGPAEDAAAAAAAAQAGPAEADAFAREDLVQQLLEEYRGPRTCHVLHVTGKKGMGKTFSMPWAVVETIRRTQEMAIADGKTGARSGSSSCTDSRSGSDSSNSSSSSSSDSSSSSSSSSDSSSSSSSGSGIIQRVQLIASIPCYYAEQPSFEHLEVLLTVAIFLGMPIVFNDFVGWPRLPAILQQVLQQHIGQNHEGQQLLSRHFIMLDISSEIYTSNASEGAGNWRRALCGRIDLGVAMSQRMPRPSLQLAAGMLQHYDNSYQPDKLLSIVSRTGFRLDLLSNPQAVVRLEDLCLQNLLNVWLETNPERLHALHVAVQHGYLNSSEPLDWELWDSGVVSASPFEHDAHQTLDNNTALLVEPQLMMMHQLQPGFSSDGRVKSREKLEQLAVTAEGKVLKFLVRAALLPVIEKRLNLDGVLHRVGRSYSSDVWGDVGQCSLDFGLMYKEEPTVWGSCKRQQSKQTAACFVPHIKALAQSALRKWDDLNKKLKRYRHHDSKCEAIQHQYDCDAVVMMMRSICSGNCLVLVGVSVVPASSVRYREVCVRGIDVVFEGQQHTVQCTYQHFLLTDLVHPMVPESCRCVRALNSFDNVDHFLADVA